MALKQINVPVSFFSGINNKTDNKQGAPGELTELENGVFTSIGKIKKRNGFGTLPLRTRGGNITEGKAVAARNEELVLFTGKDVLGFSETEETWIERGIDYSLSQETTSIVNNNVQQKNPECCFAVGLELYVWEDSSGGTRYTLKDHANETVLVADALVDAFGQRPKVVFWEGKFTVFYHVAAKIYARTIDPATPFIISSEKLLASDLNTDGPQFDCLVNVNQVLGFAYSSFGDSNKVKFVVPTALSIAGFTNYHSFDFSAVSAINVFCDSEDIFWILSSGDDGTRVCGTQTESNDSVNGNISLSTSVCLRIAGYQNTTSGNVVIFYEIPNSISYGNVIYKCIISTNGFILGNYIFQRGVSLYSKPFGFNGNYFATFTFGPKQSVDDVGLQSTYYVLDEAGNIVTRSNVNNGGGTKNDSNDGKNCGVCTDVVNYASGIFNIPFQVKTSVVSNNNTQYLPTGVNVCAFNFTDDNVFGSLNISNSLNVVGGIFKTYDGVSYTENNFLYYPSVNLDNSVFSISVLTPGDTLVPQVVRFSVTPAYRIPPSSYFTINTVNGSYFFWFRVDGIGVAPAGPGIGIIVDINSTSSAAEVATAIIAAFPTGEFTVSNISSNTFDVTNVFPGAVIPPTTGTINDGNIGLGTYLYIAIYSWTDNNGIIQNSETSVPVSITQSVTGSNTVVVPTLKLTAKNDVRIVIYRTEGTNFGSEIFYRVTPFSTPLLNDPTVDYVTFLDTAADASILANDIIYTTGGVVDNSSPPPSSICAHYKNRVFIAGLEDKNLLWYSKVVSQNHPVNFSEFLTLQCDPRGGDITALGVLDDKLIIFKEQCAFVLIGNGPADTGLSNDFDNGVTLISSDVGCTESNSIVITPKGLMFKSNKGIYIIDRGLNISYIGANVESYNDLTVTSALLMANKNQVRFTTSGAMLVYDYYVGQWGVFTNLEATDSTLVGSQYYLLRESGVVYKEDDSIFDDNGEFIKLKITTGNISLAGIQGFQRVQRVILLGSYYSAHNLQLSFLYDYEDFAEKFSAIEAGVLIGNNELWGSANTWGEPIPGVWGGSSVGYNFRVHLSRQKCMAIKISIEDISTGTNGESYDLSNISLLIGVKSGQNKLQGKQSFGNG